MSDFNVRRGWPDNRGSACDEAFATTSSANLATGTIVKLAGSVGAPTVSAAGGSAIAASQDGIAALQATRFMVVIEGNESASNFSGYWLEKVVVITCGGHVCTFPAARFDVNSGTAGTVFAPGMPVCALAGKVAAVNNDGGTDTRYYPVIGHVQDYDSTNGLLTVIMKG